MALQNSESFVKTYSPRCLKFEVVEYIMGLLLDMVKYFMMSCALLLFAHSNHHSHFLPLMLCSHPSTLGLPQVTK